MNVSHICDEGKREREILVGIPFKAVLQDQVSKVATVISMIGWCINTNFAQLGRKAPLGTNYLGYYPFVHQMQFIPRTNLSNRELKKNHDRAKSVEHEKPHKEGVHIQLLPCDSKVEISLIEWRAWSLILRGGFVPLPPVQ